MRIVTESPEETERLGQKIGRYLKEQEQTRIVCLYGDLGAGKTTLIKGIASALGVPGRDVGSASFVIVAEYETTPPFHHIDLYRVEREEDLDALGIWEYLDGSGIAVIEWAERLPDLPDGALKVTLSYLDEDRRGIEIESVDEKHWRHL